MLKKLSLIILLGISTDLIAQDGRSCGALFLEISYANELSFELPYLALGRSRLGNQGILHQFTKNMSNKFNREVVNYYDFGVYQLPGDNWAWIRRVIKSAVNRAKKSKVLLFNLDGLGHDELSKNPSSYSSKELFLILKNPKYFRATIWFKNGIEVPPESVLAEYQDLIAKIN